MHEHDDTGDKLEHAYFCYLADKFEREPELLEIPLQTISRWRKRGTWGGTFLERWETLIRAARVSETSMKELAGILRADDEETREFKGFDPFPGVLKDGEKEQFICASRH
ncbi:hypothetical protein [Prosthecobacter sp.]|uniref:hypothetical protein n=1 Tax=Prosthecobacter sp. TaxID=1965333 RepID=UPI00378344B9